jgi:ABC-type multidrug transport system ATPase subunit/peptidoglycan/LPS O-acetylase OafA/YrhL
MSHHERLHSLDAVRAFALLLGIVFHCGFSFIPGLFPGIWAAVDSQPSTAISALLFTAHIFRMSLFFFLAGLFAHMLFQRRGAAGFWLDRARRIAAPLIVGWVVLYPALSAVWIWGLTKSFGGRLPALPANMPPAPFGAFPLTHLWFLYYLLLLYGVVVGVRSAVAALDRQGRTARALDGLIRVLVRSGSAAPLLGVPLCLVLYLQARWIMWLGVPTPDQSLIPQLPALVAFGTAFAFGWLVQRQLDLLQTWARLWPIHLVAALGASAACLVLAGASPKWVPAAPGRLTLEFACCYCLALWCWVFAITGVAVRFLAGESRARRYLADSAYWLYLVHLPLVAAIQVVVAPWRLHWAIKFPLLVGATLTLLLLSYHLLVRFTWIGELLNGRRRDGAPAAGCEESPALAELRNVRKGYGNVDALAGLDLQVRPGELLAVLGPNGAGKSTAISLWLGLLQPDSGSVRVMGGSPLDVRNRREIGVMMQEVAFEPTLRVRELVTIAAGYYSDGMTPREALELTGTMPLANRMYGKLSSGQKRQAQFAIAVCGRPRLLFLDEPTVGLDVQARESMWAGIRLLLADGCSIVLTTHYLEEAEALADRVVVLNNGKLIASGTVDEVRACVSRTHISCASTLTAAQVRAWPGVLDASHSQSRLQITAVNAEAVVQQLFAADPALHRLEVHQAGLSEAFTQLTQKAA